jgi:hypothetical protein
MTDLLDALGELQGITITVRHPLHEGAMRLMRTLGVSVVVDPRAAPCAQFLQPAHGRGWRVSDRMCPECAALERVAV